MYRTNQTGAPPDDPYTRFDNSSTSPVYGHLGNTFFDAGPNMMNVAVSRARDSFIVIGNPDLFSEGSGKPSGILARHLRKKKSS